MIRPNQVNPYIITDSNAKKIGGRVPVEEVCPRGTAPSCSPSSPPLSLGKSDPGSEAVTYDRGIIFMQTGRGTSTITSPGVSSPVSPSSLNKTIVPLS